jgi:hypothetical protein
LVVGLTQRTNVFNRCVIMNANAELSLFYSVQCSLKLWIFFMSFGAFFLFVFSPQLTKSWKKKDGNSPDLGNLGCSQIFSLFFQFSDVARRTLQGRADQLLLSMCAQGHCSPKIFNCVVHPQCIASRSEISTYLPTLFNTRFALSLSSFSQI